MREYPKYLKYTTKETEKQAVEELMKYYKTREYIKILQQKEQTNERNRKDVWECGN